MMSNDGLIIENMGLSHIYLAVLVIFLTQRTKPLQYSLVNLKVPKIL